MLCSLCLKINRNDASHGISFLTPETIRLLYKASSHLRKNAPDSAKQDFIYYKLPNCTSVSGSILVRLRFEHASYGKSLKNAIMSPYL